MATDDRAIRDGFKEVLKQVNETVLEKQKAVVAEIYTRIQEKWPVYTGYSKINNQIGIGRVSMTPEPEKRPTRQGDLVPMIASSIMDNLAKLDDLVPGKTYTIRIFNPVQYAADVSFEAGRGEQIYFEATMEASAAQFSRNLL